MEDALEDIKRTCNHVVDNDPIYTDPANPAAQAIAAAVEVNMCENDCSGQGVCTERKYSVTMTTILFIPIRPIQRHKPSLRLWRSTCVKTTVVDRECVQNVSTV